MKKIIFAVIVLSLLISVPAFAEETKKDAMELLEAQGGGFGIATKDKTMMAENVSAGLFDKPMLAMNVSGGMIMLAGNKLLKYDADLNLVKEVEIPMPASAKQSPSVVKTTEKKSVPAVTESQEKTI